MARMITTQQKLPDGSVVWTDRPVRRVKNLANRWQQNIRIRRRNRKVYTIDQLQRFWRKLERRLGDKD